MSESATFQTDERCRRCSQMGMRYRRATTTSKLWGYVCIECSRVEGGIDFIDEIMQYANHDLDCVQNYNDPNDGPIRDDPCTCGFDDLRKKIERLWDE